MLVFWPSTGAVPSKRSLASSRKREDRLAILLWSAPRILDAPQNCRIERRRYLFIELQSNLNMQRFIPLRTRRSVQIVTAGHAALQRYTLGYLARCGVTRNFTDDAKHHLHRKTSALRGESVLAKQVWSGLLKMTRLQLAVAPSMDLVSPPC